MARQTTRRRVTTVVALVCGLLALAAGAWGLQRWSPFADTPAQVLWPANVQPLAEFVERTTGREFVEPISVQFVADADAYEQRVADRQPPPSTADRERAAVDEAVGRALGLWEGEVSFLAIRETYQQLQPLPVEWSTDDGTIVVNAGGDTAELSPLVRAELTLRLTQALDNQWFHTSEAADDAATSQDYQVALALGLGHAIWVHDLYVDGLADDDLEQYYSAYDERGEMFFEAVAQVPAAYRAIRVASQQLGPMFVEALTEQGRQLVDLAFTTQPPAALDQVSLPVGKYLRRDALEPVAAPPAPSAGVVRYTNQMGPFGLYLLLSTGLPVTEALTAADGWGNDRYTAYQLGDRVCVDAHIVADSRDDAGRMHAGLTAWARARPDDTDALVARNGTDLYVSACDPGPAASQPAPTAEAIDHYLGRAQEIRQRSDYSGDPALAECVAVTYFAAHSLYDDSVDYWGETDRIELDCLDTT